MWAEQKLPEEWTKQSIAQLGNHSPTTVQTGPFGAQLHSKDYVDEGVPFILIRNLQENGLDTSDMPHITYEDARRLSLYRLEPGDIVFSRVGRVGSCFLVGEEQAGWVISGQMLRIRLPEHSIDRRYLIHALRSKPVQDQITGASVGSTRQSINTQILESLSIVTPPLPEQRRIAEILDAADEAIRQTERVIAKLKAVKAGLLHDLLTRGLDEHGHLRDPQAHPEQFKDSPLGRIPREWEIWTMEELTTKIVDGVHKTPRYVESGIPFLTVENLTAGSEIDFKNVRYVRYRDHLEYSKRADPRPGDVLVSKDGTLGVARVVPDICPEFSIFVSVAQLRPDTNRVLPAFVKTFFETGEYKRQLGKRSAGTGLRHIHLEHFRAFELATPSVEEQQRITAFLDTHDARIRTEEAELAKLHQVKRGLMDDLLTGRVRVV